jgi:VRR-NUC domain
MRVRARTDANHAEIGRLLRATMAHVEDCRQFGGGMSDYICLTRSGRLLLVEVKDGAKPPSARKLTSQQQQWQRDFGSVYQVVTCELDVFTVASL